MSAWRPYPSDFPHQVAGDLRWIRRARIPQLGARRTLSLWLPPGYAEEERRYPVAYMFDGQNLFDTLRAFNQSEWRVDESMTRLAAEGLPAIVVALDHGGVHRVAEYTPFDGGRGEATLDYLANTLKPQIDATLRTLPDARNTLIAGSSMGGLMSLFAALTRPHIFGRAGVFSPALWPGRRRIFKVAAHAPRSDARIYIDNGTAEPSAIAMVRLLRERGLRDGHDLVYVRERGGSHNEEAWARRFPGAMHFLLSAAP